MPNGLGKSVCVFCGSRTGQHQNFMDEAQQIGTGLAKAGLRLVYGAGDVGLMGAVASAAIENGGDVFGVIPQHLIDREVGKTNIQTYVATETMHERKKVMFANSDAVLTLPGGPGTLDELFEVMTWRQLGLHDKPILLLNTEGYWDTLLELLDQIVEKGFADASFLNFLTICESPDHALDILRARLT